MRLVARHALVADVQLDVAEDLHMDELRDACVARLGIDGAFNLRLLNKRTGDLALFTSMATLRDDDILVLLPDLTGAVPHDDSHKRVHGGHSQSDPKRARLTEGMHDARASEEEASPAPDEVTGARVEEATHPVEDLGAEAEVPESHAGPYVTCISLKSRTDRREAVTRNVIPHLPQLVFFDAVDAGNAADLPPDIVNRMKVMPKAKELSLIHI